MKFLKLSLLTTCLGAFSLACSAAQDLKPNFFTLGIENSLTLIKVSQATCSHKDLTAILTSLNSPSIAQQVPIFEKFSITPPAQEFSRNLDLFVIMMGAIEIFLDKNDSAEIPATVLKDAASASTDEELRTMSPLDALKKYAGLINGNCESVRTLELAYNGRQAEFTKVKTDLTSKNPAFTRSCATALKNLAPQLVLQEERDTVASLEKLLSGQCAVTAASNLEGEETHRSTLCRNKGRARRGTVPVIPAEDLPTTEAIDQIAE